MESDSAKEKPPENRDKWDFVILHTDSQYELANAVRKSIEQATSTIDPPVIVVILEDLLEYGKLPIDPINDIIENAGVIMYFRTTEFFSENLSDFAVGAALEDRIEHESSRKHWTLIPIDIEKKINIPGKSCFNGQTGIIVSKEGDIEGRSREKTEARIRNLLTRVRRGSGPVDGGRGQLEQSIVQGLSRQEQEISALIPGASVPAAVTGEHASHDFHFLTVQNPSTSSFQSGPQSTFDYNETARTLSCGSQSMPDRLNSNSVADNSGARISLPTGGVAKHEPGVKEACGVSGDEVNATPLPHPTSPSAQSSHLLPSPHVSGTARVRSVGRSGEHFNSSAFSRSALPDPLSRSSDTAEQRVRSSGEQSATLTDLPHSVVPDNQSLSSRCPSHQFDCAGERRGAAGEQALPSQHQQRTVSNDRFRDSPPGNQRQNERHYWNQKGARPKTTVASFPAPNPTPEHPKSQWLDVNRTEAKPEESHAPHFQTVARPLPFTSSRHGESTMNPTDAELEHVMSGLNQTSLTPPPSPSHHDGDHPTVLGRHRFPQDPSPPNRSADDSSSHQQLQDRRLNPNVERRGVDDDRGLSQDLQQDGSEVPCDGSGGANPPPFKPMKVNAPYWPSSPRGLYPTCPSQGWSHQGQGCCQQPREEGENERPRFQRQHCEMPHSAPQGEAPEAEEAFAELAAHSGFGQQPSPRRTSANTDSGYSDRNAKH